MSRSRVSFPLLIFSATVLCAAAKPALTQEISLVPFDTTEVAKGYRANALMLKRVVNDKAESIGTIDDFMFGRDGGVFAILAVGDFIGTAAHLVAVPFKSLKLDDPSGDIVLPGASREALLKLPVFYYNR
jgi:sporulation protein YlmC with PRC-barrel domain